jgi:hypothetical protein
VGSDRYVERYFYVDLVDEIPDDIESAMAVATFTVIKEETRRTINGIEIIGL